MMNEEFIKQLAKEGAKPAIKSPQQQLILWFALTYFYALIIFYFFGIRKDLMIEIKNIFFVSEFFLIIFISLSSAFYAAISRLPDFNQNYNFKKIPLFLLTVFLVINFYKFFSQKSDLEVFCGSEGFVCAISILIFAILPALLFFIILRNGVSLKLNESGFFIGLSSGSFSYLILRLIHETEEIHHLFFWHFLPIILISFLTIICANFCLKKIL